MGEKNITLGNGTLYIDDLVAIVNHGELTATTEEKYVDDTAFPLKLMDELTITGTIDWCSSVCHVIKPVPNNWRKMHGYPMIRKLYRTRRHWVKLVRRYLAEQGIKYV